MDIIFFEKYKEYSGRTVNPALLWEYDLKDFDYQQMRNIVVQRVIERGWRNDWYAALNLYGVEGMKEVIKELPYLNKQDMHFVSTIFNITLSEMKCYEKKRFQKTHWNS